MLTSTNPISDLPYDKSELFVPESPLRDSPLRDSQIDDSGNQTPDDMNNSIIPETPPSSPPPAYYGDVIWEEPIPFESQPCDVNSTIAQTTRTRLFDSFFETELGKEAITSLLESFFNISDIASTCPKGFDLSKCVEEAECAYRLSSERVNAIKEMSEDEECETTSCCVSHWLDVVNDRCQMLHLHHNAIPSWIIACPDIEIREKGFWDGPIDIIGTDFVINL
jgi:hypothetical protein